MEPKQQEQALWRYGLICPLLHRQANGQSQGEVLRELASKTWLTADGVEQRRSAETLRKWLYRYQTGGLPALADESRATGTQVPDRLRDTLFALRQAHPRWTTQILMEACQKQGAWDGRKPSRASLYRFIKQHQLGRDPHRDPKPGRAFSFESFGQLWVADFLHGPKLRKGRHKFKTYLHAILDDHSRYVIAGEFTKTEGVVTLITDLMTAVRRHGIPQRFYVDNGAAYASRHLKLVCARLGTQLVHTPPYRPQGRGKVERWFKTVRQRFLCDRKFASLEDLNRQFQAWLSEYHDRIQASLGMSPLKKRLLSDSRCKPVPQVTHIESLFRMERRCHVYADGTIRLFRNLYEVPGCPAGSRITTYFMPWDMEVVYVGEDLTPAKKLDKRANAYRFHHPKGGR